MTTPTSEWLRYNGTDWVPVRTPYEMVTEFHRAVDAPIRAELSRWYDKHAFTRVEMLREEVREYRDALEACDIVEIADALADIVYVAYGGALEHGIDLDAVLAEVHRSNMTKVRPDGSVLKRADGKVLKPRTYEPPNIARVLGLSDG